MNLILNNRFEGVTGQRTKVSEELPNLIQRIRKYSHLPLAIGFGVGNRAIFLQMASLAHGVVVGSAIVNLLMNARYLLLLLLLLIACFSKVWQILTEPFPLISQRRKAREAGAICQRVNWQRRKVGAQNCQRRVTSLQKAEN